jgi:hypothetical protein
MITVIIREEGRTEHGGWTRESREYYADKAQCGGCSDASPCWSFHNAIRAYDKFQYPGKSLERAGEIISLLQKAS